MAPPRTVDLALHIVVDESGISGTVGRPGHEPSSFTGWLDLTAAIAGRLEAEAKRAGTDQ